MVMDIQRLKFLMDVQEKLDELEKLSSASDVQIIDGAKEQFYRLAEKEFSKTILRDIHEYIFEINISQQAKEFYRIFPDLIVQELITDFIQMENYRRRDSFENFCLSIYQQIECFVNYLFKSGKLFRKILSERTNLAFKSERNNQTLQSLIIASYNKENNCFYSDRDYNKEFSQRKIDDEYISKLNFKVKFRTVLYIPYFENSPYSYHDFNEILKIFSEVEQGRHLVHRGHLNKTPKQVEILEYINENKYLCYLKFYGFLVDFMMQTINSKNFKLI